MKRHRGEILEMAIRRGPYPIKTLAHKLGISRNTIYSKFKQYDLEYEFILKVGDIIHYDFKAIFPELKTTVPIEPKDHTNELWRMEKNYMKLLEQYEKLLGFLVKITHQYGFDKLKKEIDAVVEPTKHRPL